MGCYWEDGIYREQTTEDREMLERGERIAACINACDGWTTKELQNRCFLKTGTISESGRPIAHLADLCK